MEFCEFLEKLRTLLTATEQAAQTFAEKQAEEYFHPQLEAHLVTWITMKLPDPVKTRAYNRRSQPSVRILLTEFYFTLLPQPSEQARHLGNLVKNPTSACANPVEVITNIKNWRVSVQLYKESTGQMPIQEDIKTAFEKLISPVLKNVTGFEWKRTYCEQTAYLSITTTDDQVHAYITSVMEVIHRLPKQLKWDSSKPKVQAITSGEESTTTNQKKDKTKGKGKGKGKPKGPPLPDKGKGKGGKGKGKNKSKAKNNNAGGKTGNKGTPAVPIAAAPASTSTTIVDGQKKRPKQCVHYASSTGCLRGKDCLYLHQNDPVTKKPLPADPADVQRLSGKPQIVPKASAAPTGPPPSAQSSTAPISTPSAAPKPVVSMIRVNRRDLEPEAEPGARHRVARWRMTEGATVSNHPMGRVPEPKGGITATPHFGGLHGGRTHFGSNQSSLWCRCQLCGIRTPTVTYKDVCCASCYRLPPRGERSWTIMKNCVWVKWARLTIQFLWLGNEKENNVRVAEARRVINYRDARNTFFDAAETVDQMIEFGYIRPGRNRCRYLPPNVDENEHDERVASDIRARHLREVFFANRHPRRAAILELEDRVNRYVWSCRTTLPYDAMLLRQRRDQERAIQRELDVARDLGEITPFSPTDEQQATPLRHVAITRYSPTGTPRRRTRIELSGEYVPMDMSQPEPSVSAINVGALRAPTSGDDRYCMLDSGANVMVIPKMEGMVGDETMCSLVGDNRAFGLIVSRV